ncbi:GEM-like protein 4 [Vitis riparia]|uniref:GEM-like protein 4 n=1 Tax=Vitis riparia TaxID=96939 RepID=UPI00155A647F|nr:GEM-like protein 4 [Vitis riparia]
MSHQPEVEDSPTIFVPLNTPALYRVDQLKGFFQSLESRAFQITCCRLNCSTFRNMKSQLQEHVIGIPVSCQYDKPSLSNGSGAIIQKKWDSTNYRIKKNRKKADNFVDGVREHVRLGPKFSETVKGKLSLGARILQVGGVKRVFKQIFVVGEGEKLLKASQCYLSTTGGPIAGLLFISSQRIAFCSDRSIKFSSPNGELIRIHYKVSIPLRKIKRANQSENVKNPYQKYMEIVTVDNFDFWFMGFLNYQKAFSYLQQALCEAQNLVEK